MTEREIRERDILVAPHEFAYVQDLTKGDIVLYVGPTKISLSNTERLVNYVDGRFVPVRGDDPTAGVHRFVAATSSQYIVLENPPRAADAAPAKGANSSTGLQMGRTVIVPGPAEFPLWPGQCAQVIDGHSLREDEYLIVRVIEASPDGPPIGAEQIVRGADVSFYIPATGLEVVPDRGSYVRRAWRLETNKGLHVRVTQPFVAGEHDQVPPGSYRPGQDLFIRDREGYFFPTHTLEVVGEVERIGLAEKQGLYVRDISTGKIKTVEGPVAYLPDPTRENLVVRELDPQTAELYGLGSGSHLHALSIYIPPSFAVMVTAKNRRQVVTGPQTRILAFDEDLERLTLSTGRPKSDQELLPTCFLQVEGNKVSDVVQVKTGDHVDLSITLSYRVSFDGDPERWFNVKDYVGLLCDHLGSIIRAAARGTTIEAFHGSGAEVVRTAILGPRTEQGRREGRRFDENGMWVYDVEVLDVEILDAEVKQLLSAAQRKAIASEIARKEEQLRLGDEQLREAVTRRIQAEKMETLAQTRELEAARSALERQQMLAHADISEIEASADAQAEARALAITSEAKAVAAERQVDIRRRALEAEASAFQVQMEALAPELIATLKTLGGQQMAAELSRHLSPLAILGGSSVADVATRLLAKLPFGPGGNGSSMLPGLGVGSPVAGDDDGPATSS
ncbi:MAG: hypothetical protein JRI23_33185 [Deltaproteobacteria bacterium]|jgi:hypothetical protein|nr:hypothetical protein [Deltaproteobacteria bacterium]MBW2537127.1 hypothetical protein [Deltaproteobacteria bacterium]